MATEASIAIRKDAAVARIEESAAFFADKLGIEPLDIPQWHREANELPAVQMEVLADWLDKVRVTVEANVAKRKVKKHAEVVGEASAQTSVLKIAYKVTEGETNHA